MLISCQEHTTLWGSITFFSCDSTHVTPCTEIMSSVKPQVFLWLDSPCGSRPHCWGFAITLRHTRFGRIPLGEWSTRRQNLYLKAHNTHQGQTCSRRDSNPQSQQVRPTFKTARPPWTVIIIIIIIIIIIPSCLEECTMSTVHPILVYFVSLTDYQIFFLFFLLNFPVTNPHHIDSAWFSLSLWLFADVFVIFDLYCWCVIHTSMWKSKKDLLENRNETVRLRYPYVGGKIMTKCVVNNEINVTGSCYVQVTWFCLPWQWKVLKILLFHSQLNNYQLKEETCPVDSFVFFLFFYLCKIVYNPCFTTRYSTGYLQR
jgi:hypothetical protein